MEYNHFAYGKLLATQLKAIAHTDTNIRFFESTEQEEFYTLAERMTKVNGMVLIAIDGSNSDLMWQPDNMSEKPQYFFVIAAPTESLRSSTIHQAQKNCKAVAQQIISRMLWDKAWTGNCLESLDNESFVIRGVGPIGDNLYGVLVGFNLLSSFNYEINPDDWL